MMTDKEAMKLALEVLKKCHYYMIDAGLPNQSLLIEAFKACSALEEALAKPDFWEGYVPEPVKPAQHHSKAWPPSHWTDYERSIAAAEREACAQLATTIAEQDLPEEMPEGEELLQAVRQIAIGVLIAKAIRARGGNT